LDDEHAHAVTVTTNTAMPILAAVFIRYI